MGGIITHSIGENDLDNRVFSAWSDLGLFFVEKGALHHIKQSSTPIDGYHGNGIPTFVFLKDASTIGKVTLKGNKASYLTLPINDSEKEINSPILSIGQITKDDKRKTVLTLRDKLVILDESQNASTEPIERGRLTPSVNYCDKIVVALDNKNIYSYDFDGNVTKIDNLTQPAKRLLKSGENLYVLTKDKIFQYNSNFKLEYAFEFDDCISIVENKGALYLANRNKIMKKESNKNSTLLSNPELFGNGISLMFKNKGQLVIGTTGGTIYTVNFDDLHQIQPSSGIPTRALRFSEMSNFNKIISLNNFSGITEYDFKYQELL